MDAYNNVDDNFKMLLTNSVYWKRLQHSIVTNITVADCDTSIGLIQYYPNLTQHYNEWQLKVCEFGYATNLDWWIQNVNCKTRIIV